jgi:hypothetical protein
VNFHPLILIKKFAGNELFSILKSATAAQTTTAALLSVDALLTVLNYNNDNNDRVFFPSRLCNNYLPFFRSPFMASTAAAVWLITSEKWRLS